MRLDSSLLTNVVSDVQDTSAGAISTLFYYLGTHPHIQRRARMEVLAALGDTDEPRLDALSGASLPYLTACIREALRINTPISYIVPRKSSEPLQCGAYVIPPDTSLIIDMYAIHHSSSGWADQDVFRPERFLTNGWQQSGWLPFALGPRQCPARNFAMYESRTLAAILLRDYAWCLPDHSIHKDSLRNKSSPFALTLPDKLDLTFTKIPRLERIP